MESNWRVLSTYRDQLFGIAIISIILLHFFQDTSSIISTDYQNIISSVGVEIFLFLSGMGLYFSLAKNKSLKRFYLRRFQRILPEYLIVSTITFSIIDLASSKGILNILEDVSFVSLVLDGDRLYWFIGLILICYAFYPLIYLLLRTKYRFVLYWLLMLLAFVMIFAIKKLSPNFYENNLVWLNRIPIFIMGSYYAKKIYDANKFSAFDKVLIYIGFSLFIGKELPIPNTLIKFFSTLPLMLLFCLALQKINKVGGMNKFLKLCGSYSLELYIVHVSYRILFDEFWIGTNSFFAYFVLMVFTVITCDILKKTINRVI